MRLKQNTGTQADVINTLDNLRGSNLCIQCVALPVQKYWLGHVRRRARNQLVGTFKVVVSIQRLVNIVGIGRFIG